MKLESTEVIVDRSEETSIESYIEEISRSDKLNAELCVAWHELLFSLNAERIEQAKLGTLLNTAKNLVKDRKWHVDNLQFSGSGERSWFRTSFSMMV